MYCIGCVDSKPNITDSFPAASVPAPRVSTSVSGLFITCLYLSRIARRLSSVPTLLSMLAVIPSSLTSLMYSYTGCSFLLCLMRMRPATGPLTKFSAYITGRSLGSEGASGKVAILVGPSISTLKAYRWSPFGSAIFVGPPFSIDKLLVETTDIKLCTGSVSLSLSIQSHLKRFLAFLLGLTRFTTRPTLSLPKSSCFANSDGLSLVCMVLSIFALGPSLFSSD